MALIVIYFFYSDSYGAILVRVRVRVRVSSS